MLPRNTPIWVVAISAPLTAMIGVALVILLGETVFPSLKKHLLGGTMFGIALTTGVMLALVWIVHHRVFTRR